MNIVLTGSLAVDQIMNFNGSFAELIQPDKLHVLSLSVLIQELRRTRGGIAGNIAYTLALLGEKPILLASMGTDHPQYMDDLRQLGVVTDHVYYSQLPTATFTVMTDQKDCQVGGFYPGAMSDASTLSLEKFKDEDILVVISAHDPAQMKQQVKESVQFGKRLFYDVGQQATNLPSEDIKEGIQAAELLIVNDYEMGVLVSKTGWSEAEIKNKVTTCVITLGDQGCQITHDGEELTVSASPVERVADPTGAGDAFRAGFLYGYIRTWPVERCAQLGAVTASYAVEKAGTQEHTFTLAELEHRYQQTYHQALEL